MTVMMMSIEEKRARFEPDGASADIAAQQRRRHGDSVWRVLGPILEDQVEDYARRKGCGEDEIRRLLPSNLHA